MIKKEINKNSKTQDHNSELLLRIINKASIKDESHNEQELFVDANWKINSKDSREIISNSNENLKSLLSKLFPGKSISVINNKDGSQTIFID